MLEICAMEAMCFAETAMMFVSKFKHAQNMGGYFLYIPSHVGSGQCRRFLVRKAFVILFACVARIAFRRRIVDITRPPLDIHLPNPLEPYFAHLQVTTTLKEDHSVSE